MRKAIFDCLGDFTKGACVLELFAGSGAVGIEAVSHGAKEVVFVDSQRGCLSQLRVNLESLGITAHQIYEKDSQKAVDLFAMRNSRFDIIFLDPPYEMDLAKKILLKIGACGILAPLGILIAQHHRKEELPDRCGSLMLFKQKKYGDTVLSFYRERLCA